MRSSPSRLVSLTIVVVAFSAITYAFLQSLSGYRNSTSVYAVFQLPVLLFLFAVPIVLSWVRVSRILAYTLFGVVGLLIFISFVALETSQFNSFYLFHAGILFILHHFHKESAQKVTQADIESEKNENECNQLDVQVREARDDLNAAKEKFLAYYSLKNVAERLATTLSIERLSELILKEMLFFIPQGDAYLIYLTEPEKSELSLAGVHKENKQSFVKSKTGDLFDRWVLKSRQPLLVQDVRKDVRFDTKKMEDTSFRSIILVPLMGEEKVIGICRVQTEIPEGLQTDDLRILDALAVIASPAIANARLFHRTEELAIRDSLTGLFVQRYFRERFKEEHRRALLTDKSLSVLMADLDYFKQYNDTYGHGVGDMMLVAASNVIKEAVPEDAIVARYGGEEFAVLLPQTDKNEAIDVAERIREALDTYKLDVRRESTKITMSIGVATVPQDGLDRTELLALADKNLYQAKRRGRNQVWPKHKPLNNPDVIA